MIDTDRQRERERGRERNGDPDNCPNSNIFLSYLFLVHYVISHLHGKYQFTIDRIFPWIGHMLT